MNRRNSTQIQIQLRTYHIGMYPTKLITVLLVLLLFSKSESYNILAIFNIPSKSIHLAAVSMVEILAGKGHNVTLVTEYPYHGNNNIDHVFLKDVAEANERIFVNFLDFEKNSYSIFYDLEVIGVENCRLTFQDAAFKKLLGSDRKFDLLIIDPYVSLSLLYISEYYNVPVLMYSGFDSSYATNPLFGNPAPPAYVPNLFMKYSGGDMSFLQRLENTMIFLMNEIILNFYTIPSHDGLVREFFPDATHISKYLHKASVILLNSDVSVSEAMPKTPGMVHIGGYHIKKPKNLPEDLNEIMKNAKDGVILFSLGSNIKSSQMPKTTVEAILEIFSRLNQTIIWKWEDEDLPGKPSNVVVRKWLPQNDILAHENVKLFITHGGQHSILETVYYGVPCVSIPVFMDQGANSYRASQLGYAEWFPYKEFTPEKFERAIIKVLNDPSYRKMAKKRSKIMHDKLLSPQEELAFWVEYVIRHGGATHFQTAALKLNWYQYLLFDIVLLIVLCLVFIVFFIKRSLRLFCRSNRKKKND